MATHGPAQRPAQTPIVFDWQVSSFSGWGLYGLNLMRHWPGDAVSAQPPDRIAVTEERARTRIDRCLALSRELQTELGYHPGGRANLPMPLLQSFGNRLASGRAVHGVTLTGRPTIGVVFLEDAAIEAQRIAGLDACPLFIAGSEWNRRVLAEAGLARVTTILQGVDCELFRPRPSSGWLKDRFKVFSGGKLEFRKGQDLVALAFRAFAEHHPDAILVTAWHSPWARAAQSLAANPRTGAPPIGGDGMPDVASWLATLGIPPHQFIDLGPVPNPDMPNILRDIDVAIFPNRCEGGTNLVAMECLASGVPTILSANTGHLDLIERVSGHVLAKQTPVTAALPNIRSTQGWGESDIAEMVETLEFLYTQHASQLKRARHNAKTMQSLSWKRQIGLLHRTVTQLQ